MGIPEKPGKKVEEVYKPAKATQLFVVWRKLKKRKLSVFGLGIILAVLVVGLLAPLIAPYSPQQRLYGEALLPPSPTHPFGTDRVGRDVFSLVIYGARLSIFVGIASVVIEFLIGVAIGATAGYFGGKIDEILMRIADTIVSLPTLPLLIVAVSMFEVRGITLIILLMGFLGWPYVSRYTRSEFLKLKDTVFVEAARSMGATNWHIVIRHILPNALPTFIVVSTMNIPWYILYEATLTFLGFSDPSSTSWGVLLQGGYLYMQSAWWIITNE
jgi:ABC-type dipeptide/oligopeptide/nickel transport system permease subunit